MNKQKPKKENKLDAFRGIGKSIAQENELDLLRKIEKSITKRENEIKKLQEKIIELQGLNKSEREERAKLWMSITQELGTQK